jgi:hypothetical protein
MEKLLTVNEIVSDLLDTNDGPITDYTVIARAIELVKANNTTGEDVGNALYEALNVLKEHGGRIASNEFAGRYN